MREWAQTYTKGVRQRSVRQETTMDKSGTLPLYLYTMDIAKKAAQTEKYENRTEDSEEKVDNEQDEEIAKEPEEIAKEQ